MGTKIIADKVGRGTTDTLTTDGSLVVGDTFTDTLTVNARISSSLTPNTDASFDLGSEEATKRWNNIYASNIKPTTITGVSGGTSFSGTFDFSGATIGSFTVSDFTVLDGVVEKTSSIVNPTTTPTLDCNNGHIFYLTSIANNITPTFTNMNIATQGYATAVTLVLEQGNPAYVPGSTVSINGSSVTVQWQGGLTPTGTVNGYDAVSYSVMNNGGTLLVLGQLVSFG